MPSRIARDYEEFRLCLNDRRIELGLSMNALNTVAGLAEGYAEKLFSTARVHGGYRNIGPETMGKLLTALGLIIRLEQASDCSIFLREGIATYPHLEMWRARARAAGLKAYAGMGAVKRARFHRQGGLASAKKRAEAARRAAKSGKGRRKSRPAAIPS